jgi:hypothetical protein
MNSEFLNKIEEAIRQAKAEKPNDRSDVDRRYAIAITELEKVKAFVAYYLNGGEL